MLPTAFIKINRTQRWTIFRRILSFSDKKSFTSLWLIGLLLGLLFGPMQLFYF
jgi:hypothetical protein